MKKIFYLVFVVLFSFTSNSQSKKYIYVDENYKGIDFKEFNKKLSSELFFIAYIKTDTAIFKKLRFKEFFGKLNSTKKHQLNKLYYNRFNVDTTKIWLIRYTDTLPDIRRMPQKSTITLLDSVNNPLKKIIIKGYKPCKSIGAIEFVRKYRYDISYNDFKRIIPYEIKKFKKHQNVVLLHFYNENKGYPIEKGQVKWLKDYNIILKRSFSDGMIMYKTMIIYPNGDFYMSSLTKCYSDEKKYFRKNSFKKLEREFYKKQH